MVARYRRGGLYHLLVVSGLHVVLAAGLALAALAALRVEGKRRDAALLAAVWAFVLCAGGNPPAVRAGLVVSIFLATRLLERPIAGAAGARALGDPPVRRRAARDLLRRDRADVRGRRRHRAVLAARARAAARRGPRGCGRGIAAALAAECATAPILFWRFNVVAAGAWLTAPLAVPLCGALIAGGGALVLLYACGVPAGPLPALFGAGSRALEMLRRPRRRRRLPSADAAARGGRRRRGAAPRGGARSAARARRRRCVSRRILFAALALRPGPAGPDRGLSIEALDVGQGDAILLRWGRRSLLVDGGGTFDVTAADFGRTRLVPKLLDRGVTRLDAVLLTHPHPDHALGLFAVLEELPVGELWTSTGDDENELLARLEARRRAKGRRRPPARVRRSPVAGRRAAARAAAPAAAAGRPTRSTTSRSCSVSSATAARPS